MGAGMSSDQKEREKTTHFVLEGHKCLRIKNSGRKRLILCWRVTNVFRPKRAEADDRVTAVSLEMARCLMANSVERPNDKPHLSSLSTMSSFSVQVIDGGLFSALFAKSIASIL